MNGNIKFLIIVAFFGIFTRIYIFQLVNIPSKSMENSLIRGDKVIVNKVATNIRITIFTISNGLSELWNAAFKSDIITPYFPNKSSIPSKIIDFHDVAVFNMHPSGSSLLVKRCVGTPGDTVELINGEVIINGELEEPHARLKWLYTGRRKATSQDDTSNHTNFNVEEKFFLSKSEVAEISASETIDSLSRRISGLVLFDFGSTASKRIWTPDNFGPLVVPNRNMTIILNRINFKIYKDVIRRYEDVEIQERNGLYYISEKIVTQYKFKHNYYFFLGDNRSNSYDSRFLGLIPEKNIVGTAFCILFSSNDWNFNWSRIFIYL